MTIVLGVLTFVAVVLAIGKGVSYLSERLADHVHHLLEEDRADPQRRTGVTRRLAAVAGLFLGPARRSPSARCPVCGQECTDPAPACDRCGTLHHLDCLQYNGSCGIFGCGGSGSPAD